MSRLCGNSYDFASVASISVNLKCYKTAEGYEDTLHCTFHQIIDRMKSILDVLFLNMQKCINQ